MMDFKGFRCARIILSGIVLIEKRGLRFPCFTLLNDSRLVMRTTAPSPGSPGIARKTDTSASSSTGATQQPTPSPRSVTPALQGLQSRKAQCTTERFGQAPAPLYGHPQPAPIFIADRDDARGTGRQWDHATVQILANRPTIGVGNEQQGRLHEESKKPLFPESSFPAFPHGRPDVTFSGKAGDGLLLLPGGPNSLDTEVGGPNGGLRYPPKSGRADAVAARHDNQRDLIRDAINKGQPQLAICGGTWHMLKAYGGTTQTDGEFEAKHAEDMPELIPKGPVDGDAPPAVTVHHHKLRQHPVIVDGQSMLAQSIRDAGRLSGNPQPDTGDLHTSVNSVHWAHAQAHEDAGGLALSAHHAPLAAPQSTPRELLKVAATAAEVHGKQTVEAYETRAGAPGIAVQHHPEALAGVPSDPAGAYTPERYTKEHAEARELFRTMAQAGDAYGARRRMTAEFQSLMSTGEAVPRNPANIPANQMRARQALDEALLNKDLPDNPAAD